MIKNYFKIAVRTLIKRKGYSLLNILGLTLGMTCCLLIFHYVSYEKSYDSHIQGHENIYRVQMDLYEGGSLTEKWATTFSAVAPIVKKEYPQVEDYCRIVATDLLLANESNGKKFHEKKGYFADASFIKFFDSKLIVGNPNEALNGPDKIIISQTMAKKYFGNDEAIGKKLTVKNVSLNPLEVTGVFQDHPENSHLIMDYLVSFHTFKNLIKQWEPETDTDTEAGFNNIDFFNYLKLRDGSDPKTLEASLVKFSDKYLEPDKINKNWVEFLLIPITKIHLYSNCNQEAEVNGNGQRVSFLFLIAVFIICVAWINYINLTTARSPERAKEVGIKKVLGAMRSNLIKQFAAENFILNVLSLLLSLLFFFSLIKWFDTFTGRHVYTNLLLSTHYWLLFLALFIAGTLLSGLYPAFVLSGFLPAKVLKGAFKNSTSGLRLRKVLIVAQFSITVILIAGTIIVFKQLSFMQQKDTGINMEQTLVLRGATSSKDEVYKKTFSAFKTELLNQASVQNITASSYVLAQEIYEGRGCSRVGNTKKEPSYMPILRCDEDFISSYELKILAGRALSDKKPYDINKGAIINESALQALDFKSPADAINKKIILGIDTLEVLGVIANFHQQGLHKAIVPTCLLLTPGVRDYYSIKINAKDVAGTIDLIHKKWSLHFPDEPFNYFFLDEVFNEQYKTDILFGKVFSLFAFLAIFIACSGLLGLSSYNVLQRTKEIGIRKVLGASAKTIVVLLSKDFVKLILISLLISIPLGWYTMNEWLKDYAYRISISWWMFSIAGIAAIIIAICTISFHAMKAANANPVKSLRSE